MPSAAEFGPGTFAAGVRTLSRMVDCWQLTRQQQARLLGVADEAELADALADPERYRTDERLERLSLVFGIWRHLGTLLPDQAQADSWLRRPNSASLFRGRAAVDVLTTGRIEDLKAVHSYLAAQAS